MLTAPGPKPIREAREVGLVDRVEHLDDRALDDLVFQRGDPERSSLTVRFRDVNATRGLRAVRPSVQPLVEVFEAGLESFAVRRPGHAVDARRGVARERLVRGPEPFERDVVEERRELPLPVPACCLTYTLERTGREGPALRPGRVLLVRVPLGRAPSLHRLRGRSGDVVRRLPRYYGLV
jgi:hypothetical protein